MKPSDQSIEIQTELVSDDSPQSNGNGPTSRFDRESIPGQRKGAIQKRWPAETIEKCKMLVLAGVSLVQIAIQTEVPLGTLQKWSMNGKWSDAALRVEKAAASQVESKLAKWKADEAERYIQSQIARCAHLRAVGDKIIGEPGNPKTLEASEFRDVLAAEEKIDAMVRRNLGLDVEHSGSGGTRQFAISANSVTIG